MLCCVVLFCASWYFAVSFCIVSLFVTEGELRLATKCPYSWGGDPAGGRVEGVRLVKCKVLVVRGRVMYCAGPGRLALERHFDFLG